VLRPSTTSLYDFQQGERPTFDLFFTATLPRASPAIPANGQQPCSSLLPVRMTPPSGITVGGRKWPAPFVGGPGILDNAQKFRPSTSCESILTHCFQCAPGEIRTPDPQVRSLDPTLRPGTLKHPVPYRSVAYLQALSLLCPRVRRGTLCPGNSLVTQPCR